MTKDVSTNDLLKVMQNGFAHVDAKFSQKFTELFEYQKRSFSELIEAINILSDSTDERFNQVDARFDRLETRVTRIGATMVTKDYLDEKLFDLRGDAIAMIRRHEQKFHLKTV